MKLTTYNQAQLLRTRNILEVWTKLLYADLGFEKEPAAELRTLGLAKYHPDVSWENVLKITEATYSEHDRTRQALARAAALGGSERGIQ